MKAIAFSNRLSRDLDEENASKLMTDIQLEILDAINGGLQKLHAIAPYHSKITTGSIPLDAPISATLGVTTGGVNVTGITFPIDQFYRTIRISGDEIDNQIVGNSSLLHPYGGGTGTVNATIYCDAVAMPEPYDQMIGDPRILETGTILTNFMREWGRASKSICRPSFYQAEANARNQNSVAPTVFRFDSLPDRAYRLESRFTLAPARIQFADLLSPGADIPLRAEHVESYLLPIARGILTDSALWRDKDAKASVRNAAEMAESKYQTLTPQYAATPRNRVRTKPGY